MTPTSSDDEALERAAEEYVKHWEIPAEVSGSYVILLPQIAIHSFKSGARWERERDEKEINEKLLRENLNKIHDELWDPILKPAMDFFANEKLRVAIDALEEIAANQFAEVSEDKSLWNHQLLARTALTRIKGFGERRGE